MGKGIIIKSGIFYEEEGYSIVFDGNVNILNEISQDDWMYSSVYLSPNEDTVYGDFVIVTAKVYCPVLGGYDVFGYNTFFIKNELLESPDEIEVYCGGGNTAPIFIFGSNDDCRTVRIISQNYGLEMNVVNVTYFRKKLFGGVGGIDISDATALPTEVVKDKIFYGINGKGVGTYVPPFAVKYNDTGYISEPGKFQFSMEANDIAIIMFVDNTGIATVDTITLNDNGKWITDGLLEVKISGKNITVNNYDESGYYGDIEVYVISNPFIISPDSPN